MLISTIYDRVDIIVDSLDRLVSSALRRSGTWESYCIKAMSRFVR